MFQVFCSPLHLQTWTVVSHLPRSLIFGIALYALYAWPCDCFPPIFLFPILYFVLLTFVFLFWIVFHLSHKCSLFCFDFLYHLLIRALSSLSSFLIHLDMTKIHYDKLQMHSTIASRKWFASPSSSQVPSTLTFFASFEATNSRITLKGTFLYHPKSSHL